VARVRDLSWQREEDKRGWWKHADSSCGEDIANGKGMDRREGERKEAKRRSLFIDSSTATDEVQPCRA